MKQLIYITAIAFLAFSGTNSAFSQKKQPAADKSSKVVATVGKEQITYQQLEKAFQKNMNRKNVKLSSVPKDSVLDFLNLYINYRLKVNDALSRGFHKDSSVIDDINMNRKVLAESFYYEKKLTEPIIDQWLTMREKEYKVAVIITAFGYNNDTTAAFEKISKALKELESGKDFADVARTYSEDPETAKQGGVVNSYITAGRVNREIENAIYSLQNGEYTKNFIRTKFGYFLIKALDLQPRINLKIRTMYLSFELPEHAEHYQTMTDSLVNLVRTGKADFGKLAKEHSVDTKTATDNGYVGGYYTRSTGVGNSGETFLPELETEIYKLKPGQVTNPIKVQNGFHIFMLDSIIPIDKLAEKDEMRSVYRRLYFNEDKKTLNDSLAHAFGFKIDQAVLNELAEQLDSTKTTIDTAWSSNVDNSTLSKVLYSFQNEKITVKQFIHDISSKPELRGNSLQRDGLKSAMSKMTEPRAFDLATNGLETEYPDFEDLVREFRDGILLFKVEALEVWDKMKFDSTIARKYYDTTSMPLMRPEMFDISEIFLLNDSLANDLYRKITAGEIEFEKAANENTQRVGMRAKNGHVGNMAVNKNNLAEVAKNKRMKTGDILGPINFESGYSIVKLNKIEPPRKKTFEEAVSEIAPKVQDIIQKKLTAAWLDSVRKQFPVNIDNNALNTVLK